MEALPTDVEAVILRRRPGERANFAKLYQSRWEQLVHKRTFNDSESALLVALAARVAEDSCVVCDRNGDPMPLDEIQEYVGWSRAKVWRTLASLKAKNAVVVADGRQKWVVVNPELFFRGGRMNATLRAFFVQRRQNVLRQEPQLVPLQPKWRPPTCIVFRGRET